jgi:hypothetical protein
VAWGVPRKRVDAVKLIQVLLMMAADMEKEASRGTRECGKSDV